jgi:hypothetical protein
MADLSKNQKRRLAGLVRMLHSKDDERRTAFVALERVMADLGLDWRDIGNFVESGNDSGNDGDGKYSEAEMVEAIRVARAEGVEDGARIAAARSNGGGGGGELALPPPREMARFCNDRLGQLKDANQREFIGDMLLVTQRRSLSRGQLGYLASIYIQIGGKT